jgi:hypothetical protein
MGALNFHVPVLPERSTSSAFVIGSSSPSGNSPGSVVCTGPSDESDKLVRIFSSTGTSDLPEELFEIPCGTEKFLLLEEMFEKQTIFISVRFISMAVIMEGVGEQNIEKSGTCRIVET